MVDIPWHFCWYVVFIWYVLFMIWYMMSWGSSQFRSHQILLALSFWDNLQLIYHLFWCRNGMYFLAFPPQSNGQVQKSNRINSDRSPRIEWKTFFFKPKLFDVCTNFTKVSLEIRARVISWGLIIFLRQPEVSDQSWSGPIFVPAFFKAKKYSKFGY